MPFKNRIRLPFILKNTQFPSDIDAFTKSNGETKTLSVVIRKTYIGETDSLPDFIHQRLIVALSHDEVNIESQKFVGQIVRDGDYQIEWQNYLQYPLGKAEVQLKVTPFNASNYHCGTCSEYQQLDLEDDTFYADLDEGQVETISVFDNDSICCSPFTAEIVSYNTSYLSAASINETTGEVSLTVKPTVASATNILLATYRVTCPNGGYDDANIYGNINGSVEVCQPVSNLAMDTAGQTTALITWTASGSAVNQYQWALYLSSNLGSAILTGNTTDTFVNLTGLTPGTDYTFIVIVDCLYNDNDSETESTEFTTLPTSGGSCGSFTMTNDNFPSPPTIAATWYDCNGVLIHEFISTSITRCLLMSSPGEPVYLVIHAGGSYVYNGLCEDSLPVEVVTAASELLACSGEYETRYIAATDLDIHTGVAVYFDEALSSPVGSGYIKDITGEVFVLNSGIVGATTGTIC